MYLSSLKILFTPTLNDGLGLGWFVLIGLLGSLSYSGWLVGRVVFGTSTVATPSKLGIAIPICALMGTGVASYLTYIEVAQVGAVCGPVGDCNAVQNSAYATLLGVPLGVLGFMGYGVILGSWFWGRQQQLPYSKQMPLIIFGAALFSVLFSIYLTVVELFVLQAVCIWCLLSAGLVTLILLAATRPMLASSTLGAE